MADIQNFALRVHCVRTACMAFPIKDLPTNLRTLCKQTQDSKKRTPNPRVRGGGGWWPKMGEIRANQPTHLHTPTPPPPGGTIFCRRSNGLATMVEDHIAAIIETINTNQQTNTVTLPNVLKQQIDGLIMAA